MNDFGVSDNLGSPAPPREKGHEKTELIWLFVAMAVTLIAWQFPTGNYIVYPFTILATWFHEMGHGLTALCTGGRFSYLLLFPDGSGIAYHSSLANQFFVTAHLKDALVSAGGPLGPPIAGAIFILCSRHLRTTRFALIALGSLMLLSVLLWIRSLFGAVAIGLWGLTIFAIVLKAPRWVQEFAIQLLGVQACLSTFHQLDYLFTAQADIGGQVMLSDSSQIAAALLLPYWFWGGLMAAFSFALLFGSIYFAYRKPKVKTMEASPFPG